MALSGTLLPSIATFAAGAAGREKAARPAGPGNVSIGVAAARAGRAGAGAGEAAAAGAGRGGRGAAAGRRLSRCPSPRSGGGRSCRS